MLVTGFKSFDEVSLQTMWNLPHSIALDNYYEAFSKLAPHLWNSLIMVVPAAIISSIVGAINVLCFLAGASAFKYCFPLLLFGMFIPYRASHPLAVFMKNIGLAGSMWG